MALMVTHRQPIAWPVLAGFLMLLLVAFGGQLAGKGVAALTGHAAVSAAVEIDAGQALLIEGQSWKGVATAAAIGALFIGVAIATGGLAVAAAGAGLAGTGMVVTGSSMAGGALYIIDDLYNK